MMQVLATQLVPSIGAIFLMVTPQDQQNALKSRPVHIAQR